MIERLQKEAAVEGERIMESQLDSIRMRITARRFSWLWSGNRHPKRTHLGTENGPTWI
jgi:hypothetical protein